jgi:hypothetical protein
MKKISGEVPTSASDDLGDYIKFVAATTGLDPKPMVGEILAVALREYFKGDKSLMRGSGTFRLMIWMCSCARQFSSVHDLRLTFPKQYGLRLEMGTLGRACPRQKTCRGVQRHTS